MAFSGGDYLRETELALEVAIQAGFSAGPDEYAQAVVAVRGILFPSADKPAQLAGDPA